MTQRQQDSSGDYGYDLVHEEVGARPAPADRPGTSAAGAPATVPSDETSGDLGYDEAHDF